MDSPNILPLYAQLLGVGVLWVTIHCSGMCGPIMAGLVVGGQPQVPHNAPWKHRLSVVQNVLAYQGGRGLMYTLLGVTAGLLGASIEAFIQPVTALTSLVVAIALLAAGFFSLPDVIAIRHALAQRRQVASATPPAPRKPSLSTRFVSGMMRILPTAKQLHGPKRMFATGFILGLLPCMLMFWVLGLAASSASPLHGALLMLTLIALTTPVLLAAGLSTTLISPRLRRFGQTLIPAGMMFSGLWLLLIGLAANGIIEHIHLPFRIGDSDFTIMVF